MKVGLFVDAYNVYYAAAALCGKSVAGWRWLDLAALVEPRIGGWPDATLTEVHYCTARRGRSGQPSSSDQDTYLSALQTHDPTVRVHLGKYVARTKRGVLLDQRHRPSPWRDGEVPPWLHARQVIGPEGDPEMLVSIRAFEEKGSDVNLATQLLRACFQGSIDAAVVITNDSDLAAPLTLARTLIPVGLLNPGARPLAADLADAPSAGVGGHWWGRLTPSDYFRSQLPPIVGDHRRPSGW